MYCVVCNYCFSLFTPIQIIVNSMHKYEPRLHVVETSHMGNVNKGEHHMFVFPRTQFMTVTAYQNDKVTSQIN